MMLVELIAGSNAYVKYRSRKIGETPGDFASLSSQADPRIRSREAMNDPREMGLSAISTRNWHFRVQVQLNLV